MSQATITMPLQEYEALKKKAESKETEVVKKLSEEIVKLTGELFILKIKTRDLERRKFWF